MDTSKEYAEMCRKAKCIQDLWLPEIGDFCCLKHPMSDFGADSDVISEDGPWKLYNVWLPRQDQLQEMVEDSTCPDVARIGTLLFSFHEWWLNGGNGRLHLYRSMEQLWLAFVMKEKYGKVWNGTDWIIK